MTSTERDWPNRADNPIGRTVPPIRSKGRPEHEKDRHRGKAVSVMTFDAELAELTRRVAGTAETRAALEDLPDLREVRCQKSYN
ncbi:hypothetical protein [Amycolatopsis sp. NPDC004378]